MAEQLPIKYETLANKTAIITGGASGLGLATAERFASHGAYVTLADQNSEDGHKAVTDLTSKGYHVSFIQCDVTDWSSSVAAFKHAINFGPSKTLDIACLYAGLAGDPGNLVTQIARDNPNVDLDQDPVETNTKIIDVNLDGQIKSANLALHYFRLSPSADAPKVTGTKKSLFLVASLAGYIDYNSTTYCISKFGVRGLFRSLRAASRLPESIFTVNVVCPGYTPTPMTLNFNAGEGTRQDAIGALSASNVWAPVEHVVDCASLCVTNEEVNGRSFGTWPTGWFDLMEDLDHGFAGTKLLEEAERSGYRKAGIIT